jgi:ABC-type glycerol-3-phosphate transport system permease component
MSVALERQPVLVSGAFARRGWNADRARMYAGRVVLYLILAVGAVVVTLPVAWMIMSSLKSNVEIHSFPLHFFPAKAVWMNYAEVLYYGWTGPIAEAGTKAAMNSLWPRYFLNTSIIAVFVLIGTLFSNALVAFSFSRLRWRFRNQAFFVVLATMMLPGQVTMIPTYIIFTRIFHWTDTWLPQIVPAFFGSAWAIFLLRQFMMTIPVEIDESARLDGCGDWTLFWNLILPMSKPALGAIAIFTFTGVWNDMFTPLLYIRKPELMNVAIGLANMRTMGALSGLRFPRDELQMAAALIVSIPLIILFFVFQRSYIQGVVITGVKG